MKLYQFVSEWKKAYNRGYADGRAGRASNLAYCGEQFAMDYERGYRDGRRVRSASVTIISKIGDPKIGDIVEIHVPVSGNINTETKLMIHKLIGDKKLSKTTCEKCIWARNVVHTYISGPCKMVYCGHPDTYEVERQGDPTVGSYRRGSFSAYQDACDNYVPVRAEGTVRFTVGSAEVTVSDGENLRTVHAYGFFAMAKDIPLEAEEELYRLLCRRRARRYFKEIDGDK